MYLYIYIYRICQEIGDATGPFRNKSYPVHAPVEGLDRWFDKQPYHQLKRQVQRGH